MPQQRKSLLLRNQWLNPVEVKNVDPANLVRLGCNIWRNLWRTSQGTENLQAKSQNFEFLWDLYYLKQNFTTLDATEVTQEYVPQQPTQEYTAPLAAEQTQIFAGQMSTEAGPAQKKQKAPKTKGGRKFPRKRKLELFLLFQSLVMPLLAAFFSSLTHVSVTADKFIKVVDTRIIARQRACSTDNDKWTKDEAESFITSMEDQGSISAVLNKIIDNGGEGSYTDKSGNKIFGLEKADKKFGIF